MHCVQCKTNFCYRCGDRLRRIRFFGDHYSKLSVLGCKYSYKPNKPFQRRFIRGTVLGGKLVALPVLTTVGLCVGAVVLAVGVTALPLFGGIQIYRYLWNNSHNRLSGLYNYRWQFQFPINGNRNRTNRQRVERSAVDNPFPTSFDSTEIRTLVANYTLDEDIVDDTIMTKHQAYSPHPKEPNEALRLSRLMGKMNINSLYESDDSQSDSDSDDVEVENGDYEVCTETPSIDEIVN